MLFTSLSRISRLPCYVFCSCSCLLRRFVCGSINLIFWPLHTYLHQNSNNKYKVLAKARQCSICQILITTILYWYVLGKCNIFFLNVLLRINWYQYQYFSGWKKTILSTFFAPFPLYLSNTQILFWYCYDIPVITALYYFWKGIAMYWDLQKVFLPDVLFGVAADNAWLD